MPHVMCCKAPPTGVIHSPDHLLGSIRQDLDVELTSPSPEGEVSMTTSTGIVTDMNEQDVMDKLHPVWYGRKHGYHGTTHKEAMDFCRSVGDMFLCPKEAYCPDGPGAPKPLFLQREAFEGEQWAPVIRTNLDAYGSDDDNEWVLIGTFNDLSWSTCMTYSQINQQKHPEWGIDGSQPELKENVLCCQNPNNRIKEQNYVTHLDPIWLDDSHGWKGGSHKDAMEFCSSIGRKKLCPYAAYCPYGPGHPAIGGHTQDFSVSGEQWAPIYGENSNHWVMIGQKYDNSATTCMDNYELEGGEPDWGLSEERAEVKNHIMCCSF